MGHITCNFLSYTFNRAVTINLILPTLVGPEIDWKGLITNNTHQVKTKYPILYLLHGGINDYSTWERYTSIERYAEVHRIAVVTFSAENKSYINMGGTAFTKDNFYDFVRYELPDFLGSLFPISTEPQHSYIAGLSMGGGGSMLHVFSHPESYAAAGFFSAALMGRGAGGSEIMKFIPPQWDNETILRDTLAQGKKLPPIYMAMGTKDFGYERWKETLKLFQELGLDITSDVMEGYEHEWPFWDIQIQKFLDWIPRTDEYAKDSRKRRV